MEQGTIISTTKNNHEMTNFFDFVKMFELHIAVHNCKTDGAHCHPPKLLHLLSTSVLT